MATQIRASDIEGAADALQRQRRDYLRQSGWEETCDVPGSFWLWAGKLPDGREVLCDLSMAVSIQGFIDSPPDDGPEYDPDDGD